MLKDITIGQYFPGNSIIHKIDPRMKIILTMLIITLVLMVSTLYAYLVLIGLSFLAYTVSKIPIKMIIKSLKPIFPIVILTSVLNLFFVQGDIIFKYGIIKITQQGVDLAIVMSFRVLTLIALTSILTYTTSPMALTDAIERLLHPLKKIKLPVHELSMMMTIALRFIPTLIEETDKIISAQKARGADMESGGLIKRTKAMLPVLIPLLLSAFRRAEELALAMECRCYNGGEGRTRLKVLVFTLKDYISLFVLLFIFVGIVLINNF